MKKERGEITDSKKGREEGVNLRGNISLGRRGNVSRELFFIEQQHAIVS